jgi:hypothetical protein
MMGGAVREPSGDEEGGWLVWRLKWKWCGRVGAGGRASGKAQAGGVVRLGDCGGGLSAARGAVVMPPPVAVGLSQPRAGLAATSWRPVGAPAPPLASPPTDTPLPAAARRPSMAASTARQRLRNQMGRAQANSAPHLHSVERRRKGDADIGT